MTTITTATATTSELGPLTQLVYQFIEAQTQARLAGIKSPEDWAPRNRRPPADRESPQD